MVKNKDGTFDKDVGFTYEGVIVTARTVDAALQRVVYNVHKREHALRFQTVHYTEGMFYHV